MTAFDIIDAPRPVANAEHHRVIADYFGHVEPFIEHIDSWVALPLRLVHDDAAGWHLELGRYSLNGEDIAKLRQAIAAYDAATSPSDTDGAS